MHSAVHGCIQDERLGELAYYLLPLCIPLLLCPPSSNSASLGFSTFTCSDKLSLPPSPSPAPILHTFPLSPLPSHFPSSLPFFQELGQWSTPTLRQQWWQLSSTVEMSSKSHTRRWSKALHGDKVARNSGKMVLVKCCFQDTRGAPPGFVPLMCSFSCFKFFDVSFWATLVQSRAHQPMCIGSWYNHLEMWNGWCKA